MRNFGQQQRKDQEDRKEGQRGSPVGRSRSIIWIVLLFLIGFWVWSLFGGLDDRTEISYTIFREQVQGGNVSEVTVSGEEITGTLEEPAETTISTVGGESTVEYTNFLTYLPSFGDEELFSLLRENEVQINTQPAQEFSIVTLLINFLPFLLLIGIGFLFLRRMQGQGQDIFSMGRSRAKLYDQKQERTTFADVAGAHGAKRELQEIIGFLKNPSTFQRLGGEIPKGVLLVGPPGTGKTLLARAVAGEASVPFFNITGSDFMEMFVGVGASRVRDMFEDAKKASPSIIFIDELDSIGRTRGAGIGGGHDEREQTLNQLLNELDGFEPKESVIVMAATNRPDILDPALLRPGRFDRRITVNLPTMKDREEILRIHSRNKPLAEDVNLERIARGTPGFSGADLENMLNEAALLAARKDKDAIEDEDMEEARDKVLMGLERESLALTETELRILAYHEAGHAVVAAVLPNADPIHKVTIVPRGQAMGVTQQLPERDRYIYPKEYMLDRLAVMMGGRASEAVNLNTMTSGAENDLKQATKLARKMVVEWGMSERLGHQALEGGTEQVFLGEELAKRREYSEYTAQIIDEEVKNILEAAFQRSKATLQEHQEGLDRLVNELLDKEEIPGHKVLEILGVEEKEPVKASNDGHKPQ
ncbi:MAG TPA: ATP-dependent zinc metalloprotease FtsH [Anaerolineales bacterium]